jgi:ubiquinone biosynthesis accessory factor UbiJ
MFKPLINFVLQHIMQQNSWAAPHLQAHHGNTICFDFSVAQAKLTILESGELCMAADTASADATVYLPPSLALRLIRKDALAMSMIKIDGDAGLATEVSKILSTVRWDYEGDLSQIVGDVAAYSLVKLGKYKANALKGNGLQLAEMLVEYWQEEQPLMAKKTAVEQFNQSVDTLRQDADRLEKRINKLLNSQKEAT